MRALFGDRWGHPRLDAFTSSYRLVGRFFFDPRIECQPQAARHHVFMDRLQESGWLISR